VDRSNKLEFSNIVGFWSHYVRRVLLTSSKFPLLLNRAFLEGCSHTNILTGSLIQKEVYLHMALIGFINTDTVYQVLLIGKHVCWHTYAGLLLQGRNMQHRHLTFGKFANACCVCVCLSHCLFNDAFNSSIYIGSNFSIISGEWSV
jgi:hypothetical protein